MRGIWIIKTAHPAQNAAADLSHPVCPQFGYKMSSGHCDPLIDISIPPQILEKQKQIFIHQILRMYFLKFWCGWLILNLKKVTFKCSFTNGTFVQFLLLSFMSFFNMCFQLARNSEFPIANIASIRLNLFIDSLDVSFQRGFPSRDPY